MPRKYLIETIIFLTYAFFAVSWVSGSLMAPVITSEFSTDGVAAATWSTNAITIAKIIGNILAVWFLTKLQPKKAFAFAAFLIVLGVTGIWAPSYWAYLVSRLIMGFGGAFIIVYFGPIVMNYFSADERPVINGINSVAFNTGNLIALLFTGTMLSTFGSWRMVFVAICMVSIVLLILWWVAGEDFKLSGGADSQNTGVYTLSDGLRDPFNWYLPFAYSGILFAYIAIFALFPLVPGFAVPAKNLSALMIAAGMVGTIAGIVIAKTYPFRVPLIRYGGLLMSACVALMAFTQNPAIAYTAAFLAGFFMFLPMTAMLTLPQELPDMNPGRVTVVFGMFWGISYAIETVWMFCASTLADVTGNRFSAVVFVLVCSLSAFLASFLLPETGRRKAAEPAKP